MEKEVGLPVAALGCYAVMYPKLQHLVLEDSNMALGPGR